MGHKNEIGKAEYAFWNAKEHTPENLYENMPDATYEQLLTCFAISNHTRGLELGCGDGPFARRLQHKHVTIYGVDIARSLLKLTTHLTPVQGDALQLPFQDDSFDWVIYAFSSHHTPDHAKALKEAIRVLIPAGRIYLVEPNYYHPIRFLTRKPGTFLRKYVFTYLSPEERWLPLFRLKRILRANQVRLEQVEFLTPEFLSSTVSGKIQNMLAKVCNFGPVNKLTQSYYLVIGTKTA